MCPDQPEPEPEDDRRSTYTTKLFETLRRTQELTYRVNSGHRDECCKDTLVALQDAAIQNMIRMDYDTGGYEQARPHQFEAAGMVEQDPQDDQADDSIVPETIVCLSENREDADAPQQWEDARDGRLEWAGVPTRCGCLHSEGFAECDPHHGEAASEKERLTVHTLDEHERGDEPFTLSADDYPSTGSRGTDDYPIPGNRRMLNSFCI